MAKSNKDAFLGTGRRKSSIARVRLTDGKGKITINGKDIEEFFGEDLLKRGFVYQQFISVAKVNTHLQCTCFDSHEETSQYRLTAFFEHFLFVGVINSGEENTRCRTRFFPGWRWS